MTAVYVGELVHQAEAVQRKTTLDLGRTLRTALGIKGSPLLEEPQGPQRPRTF